MARTDPRPHTRKRVSIQCQHCGVTVEKQVSQILRGMKYCSQDCYWKSRAAKTFNAEAGTKHCAMCGAWKPLAEFPLATRDSGTHGRQAYCVPCGVKKNNEWRVKNPQRRKEISKKAYWKRPEEYRRKARTLSPERRLKKNAHARAYRLENKDKVRWWNKLRLHRQRAAGAMPDRWHFSYLLCAQDARCVYCGLLFYEVKYEIDHKIPVSRGGTNEPDNLQLVCPTCNMKKGSKTDAEYRMQLAEH